MVSSVDMPVRGEKRDRRARPVSMTTRTPSIVRLVSAIEVDSTTLRRPGGDGAIARSCSPGASVPCNAKTSTSCPSASASSTRWISGAPGKKTRTSPSGSLIADLITPATNAVSKCPMRREPAGGGRWRVSTSNCRPDDVAIIALPRRRATAVPSMVADITATRSSGRTSRRVCMTSARPVSAWRLRS